MPFERKLRVDAPRDVGSCERLRLLGYTILVPVLQALAAEYLLNGMATRDKDSCLKTHELHYLHAGSKPTIQDCLTPVQVSDIGWKLPEFIEGHRNQLGGLRYVLKGRGASTHHAVLDRTLEALVATSDL